MPLQYTSLDQSGQRVWYGNETISTTVGIWYRNGTLVVWEWDIFLYLFGVKVVAILSMCVPVLDADGGSPLVAADLRDGVIPQP